jgi:hypothetical protein
MMCCWLVRVKVQKVRWRWFQHQRRRPYCDRAEIVNSCNNYGHLVRKKVLVG